MFSNEIGILLENADGVETKIEESFSRIGQPQSHKYYLKTGDKIVLKKGYEAYIEITRTLMRGTIGRIVGFDIKTYKEKYPNNYQMFSSYKPNQLVVHDATIIYEVDGQKKKYRVKASHAKLLPGIYHKTKYIRTKPKPKEKVIIAPHINKFKQTIDNGDWVIGLWCKKLAIGKVTRYTKSNIWVKINDSELKLDNPIETFKFDDDANIEQILTFLKLKGAKFYD